MGLTAIKNSAWSCIVCVYMYTDDRSTASTDTQTAWHLFRYSATFCSISLSSEPRGSKSLTEDIAAFQQQLRLQRSQKQFQQQLVKRRVQQMNHSLAGRKSRERGKSCCTRIPLFTAFAGLLFLLGVGGIVLSVYNMATAAFDTDQVLFLGALVSFMFSLIVVICYAKSRTVRSHPNPLIFSKR